MREIKFRAFYDNRMHSHQEAMRILYNLSTESHLTPHYPVMQFAGLKDKNGKEIYEGDVIQNVAEDGSKLSIFEIIYDIQRGGFCKDRIDDNRRYMLEPSKFYEVIGNIYENPELLK